MGKPPTKKPPAAAAVDGDEAVFLELSRELKEEGVRLFNRRDYEGAAFKYDKAIQLLPRGQHVETAHLRASVAQCYMRMIPGEYHRAIHECNLALEASPRYTRALLRRASCFEALGRPDLAWGDVERVLRWEPGNRAAQEISERLRAALEEKGGAFALDREAMPQQEEAADAKGERKSHEHFDSVAEGQEGNHVVPPEEEAASKKGNNQAKHLEEKKLKHGHDKQEKQDDHTETNGIGNHRKYLEDNGTNGLEMQENNTERKQENDTGNKRGRHGAGKKKRRSEGKQKKHSFVKPVDHGEDNHYKHIEENNIDVKGEAMMDVKLVFGEDIRCAQMPANCSLTQLREIVQIKFPSLKALLIKYKDKEDDLVTVTSSEELRWATNLADPEGPLRLYVVEVDPVQELGVDGVRRRPSFASLEKNRYIMSENGSIWHDDEHKYHVDDWMIQFAQLFKNHVGFNSDAYLHLHDLGMRLYYEAMEDTIESEEAQEIFQVAELKFQEMAALALFNWGNVHMSRARKKPCLPEDALLDFILEQVKVSYEWACREYVKAGAMFEEAVKTKSDFFEGLIALGQQQFEQAKLSWYYALACKIDMGTQVLELFNYAEYSMEKGMDMWERMESLRLRGLSKPKKEKVILEKMGLEGFMKDMSADEAFEQASSIRSHINILWGTILYERSVVEFNLGLPSWEETLTVAMEKFKIGGASLADINVIVKNHCANETTQEGLSFKVEEIVRAWNEMYDAKKWRSGALPFRLQPIFWRRAPKLHHILEHIHYA
ncbi:HSP-interacting protein-like [Phragmites australis]|uniref:HSP-interacting protein-like n=1 Tax=Phragmites australis TaxID=29695 RepID=UPI002D77F792|nr:HSP-interacting protein-like [Phragmites australis]XP_062195500.1 HSP-interacting protein-like [Phragmites australis]XP_062195501.1 HSP-interacting protein-like [Phragmites australis]